MTEKTTMPFLSIVIPVYNEEENIRPLFEKMRSVCETIGDTYEILFVDDGSIDNTFTELSELHKEVPFLQVIRFQKTPVKQQLWQQDLNSPEDNKL